MPLIKLVLLGAALAVSLTSPAMAGSEPATRLVSCHAESCVEVTGHRDDPASTVSINGHPVAVAGRHTWRVRLPVETVRQWSPPFSRSIEVAVLGIQTSVPLPIGLLGHTTDLAALVIHAR